MTGNDSKTLWVTDLLTMFFAMFLLLFHSMGMSWVMGHYLLGQVSQGEVIGVYQSCHLFPHLQIHLPAFLYPPHKRCVSSLIFLLDFIGP